jgi:hypothetical protein
MGKALATACLVTASFVAAACQPMYAEKADPLKDPSRVKPPKVVTTEPELPFVNACDVNFSAKPIKQRQAVQSQTLTTQGNASLQPTITAPVRPSTPATIQTVQDAIAKYREALIKDPYNAEATLKLALAYDRVLRKGCALALLRRLDSLASSPTFQPDAEPMVDLVVQNPHWFRPYHDDAVKAVGR